MCFSNSQEKSEFQELIAFHGTEMANIIDDLLVWARGDIGEVHVIPERVNLVESVRTTLKSMPQMEVPLRADDERLFALADPARVRQIVRNLATNAMRYGRDDVEVLVRREDGAAIADVCDNGEEIPAQLRDQMFEPYARAHGRSSQPDSIGLGLTVARTLARLQDGDGLCQGGVEECIPTDPSAARRRRSGGRSLRSCCGTPERLGQLQRDRSLATLTLSWRPPTSLPFIPSIAA